MGVKEMNNKMFDLATLIWIVVGVAYSALFLIDSKRLSKKKTKVIKDL